LLALRALLPVATTTAEFAAAAVPGTTSDAAQPLPVATPPLPSPDELVSLAATTERGNPTGDALPESGKELPAAATDIDELLTSLALPGVSPPAAATQAPAPPADTSANPLPSTTAPGTTSPAALPGQGTDVTAPTAQDAQPEGFAADHLVGAPSNDAGRDAIVDDVPGIADGPALDAGGENAGQCGMELALPAQFRARLDALINATGRPLLNADGSALTANAPAPTPITSNGIATTPPAGAADVLFEGIPTLDPLNDRQTLAQGLGERMLLMAERGLQSATIRLQPEHLGQMEIRIRVNDDGAAQVHFSAHHAQTREALEGAIPRLRELFADQGLSLTQANVDSGRSAFAQRDFQAGAPLWLGQDRDAPDMPTAAGTAWRIARPSERRLDVLV
jgi:flagellar hook-length control protein FliK